MRIARRGSRLQGCSCQTGVSLANELKSENYAGDDDGLWHENRNSESVEALSRAYIKARNTFMLTSGDSFWKQNCHLPMQRGCYIASLCLEAPAAGSCACNTINGDVATLFRISSKPISK